MLKKKLGFLAGVMVLLSLAAYAVCFFAGSRKLNNKEGDFLLVTSFYPMYVLAENLTEGVEGVSVSNLTENQTGCLHDYQLSSRDMKLLSQADAFLINGAGMELFMEKVMENNCDLPVLEASRGITLLAGVSHVHSQEHSHEQEGDFHEQETYVGHSHEENGHVWMDVERYRMQAETLTKELVLLLPEKRMQLEHAWAVYEEKLENLQTELSALRDQTEGKYVVIFHEAFAYLADSLGMEVLMSLSLDEETVPSAGEIAEVIEEIRYHGTALILIEQTYASYAEKLLAETDSQVVYLDPLTTGDGSVDSYLNAMWKNLDAIRQTKE